MGRPSRAPRRRLRRLAPPRGPPRRSRPSRRSWAPRLVRRTPQARRAPRPAGHNSLSPIIGELPTPPPRRPERVRAALLRATRRLIVLKTRDARATRSYTRLGAEISSRRRLAVAFTVRAGGNPIGPPVLGGLTLPARGSRVTPRAPPAVATHAAALALAATTLALTAAPSRRCRRPPLAVARPVPPAPPPGPILHHPHSRRRRPRSRRRTAAPSVSRPCPQSGRPLRRPLRPGRADRAARCAVWCALYYVVTPGPFFSYVMTGDRY